MKIETQEFGITVSVLCALLMVKEAFAMDSGMPPLQPLGSEGPLGWTHVKNVSIR